MTTIRNAAVWVWDFVVGDARLVIGVIVAIAVILLFRLLDATGWQSWGGLVFFLLIVAALIFSLWKEFTPARP